MGVSLLILLPEKFESMMKHVKISFKSSFYEDGFGFSCMKTAYLLEIKGRMDYGPGAEVTIQAEGEQGRVDEFIQWVKNNVKDPSNLKINDLLKYNQSYKEFDIFLNEIPRPTSNI